MKLQTALYSLMLVGMLCSAQNAYAQAGTPAPYSGQLRVCLVLAAISGSTTTIVDGSAIPGSRFRQRFIIPTLDSNAGIQVPTFTLPETEFRVPLNLNSKLVGIPNGPGASANNAECVTYYNVVNPPGMNRSSAHFYDQTQIQGSGWNQMRYHDGWLNSFTGLSSTDRYYDNLIDGNPNNNDQEDRNGNADGNICMGECSGDNQFTRTLVLYNYYDVATIPTPAPTTTPIPNFFNITNGNVFSNGNFTQSITNLIPATQRFINEGMLLTKQNNHFGRNINTVVDYYDEQYTTSEILDYESLYRRYQNRIQGADLTVGNGNIESGVYVHRNGANTDLEISNGSPFRSLNAGRKVVVFVEGNLYIGPISSTNAIQVPADGKTFLAFIVRGNIGIHPNMRRIDGVYAAANNNLSEKGISKGFVDFACNRSQGGFNNSECAPNATSTANTLEVNGFMYASGGYNLQRNSTSGNPTETFTLRPDFYLSGAEFLTSGNLTWQEVSN